VSNLLALDGKTNVAVNASSVNSITDTIVNLNTAYNSTGMVGLGNENITITNTGTITSAQINDLLPETSGTITLAGSGSLAITVASGETLDLSGVTNSLSGNLSITDSTGNETITGTSANDTLTLSSGNDTVNLGNGSDTINTTISNLDTSDNISDGGSTGSDTLNITNSGTINSANLIDVNGIETLNLSSGADTITFADTTQFNAFRNEFTDIVDAGGSDTLSFGSSAVTGDLDFSKLSEFETLNLSSNDDNLTISGDEPATINGLAGNDTFSLDFSSIRNLDGGANTDTVSLTGNTGSISSDTDFNESSIFTNIEKLDITSLNLNTSDNNTEFNFTEAMIDAWTGNATGNLTLSLTSSQVEKIKFTDSSSTVHDSYNAGTSSDIHDNTVYTIGDNTLTIDITDVP